MLHYLGLSVVCRYIRGPKARFKAGSRVINIDIDIDIDETYTYTLT